MRPPSYREQKACATCDHAWEIDDGYDDETGEPRLATFCVRVIGLPPPAPPTNLAISKREAAMGEFLAAEKAWNEKADKARVSDFGVCDEHEQRV